MPTRSRNLLALDDDLRFSDLTSREKREAETLLASVHSWNLVRPPGGAPCELVLKLAGCPLRCHSCPAPDTRVASGGHDVSLTQAVCCLWMCHRLLTETGGGITVTGGDPFAQPRFTGEILRHAHEAGLRTLVETPGYLGALVPDQVLRYVDRHVIDLKTTDPDLFRRFAGTDVQPVLAFAERLSGLRRDTVIRFLVVPGVTDTEPNLAGLARFVTRLAHPPRVELAGFRHLGLDTYRRMGLSYRLGRVPPATAGHLARVERILAERGCPVSTASAIFSLEPPG